LAGAKKQWSEFLKTLPLLATAVFLWYQTFVEQLLNYWMMNASLMLHAPDTNGRKN
jgi:hypothetical protein